MWEDWDNYETVVLIILDFRVINQLKNNEDKLVKNVKNNVLKMCPLYECFTFSIYDDE